MRNSNYIQTIDNLTFITGGVRSGKSGLAEQLAKVSSLPVVYLATLQDHGTDSEVRKRIVRHRQSRPPEWQTIEEPIEVATTLRSLVHSKSFVIIDCLSLMISNLLLTTQATEPNNPREESPVPEQSYLTEQNGPAAAAAQTSQEQESDAVSQKIHSAVDSLLHTIRSCPHLRICLVSSEVGSGLYPLTYMGRVFCDCLGEANQSFARVAQQVFLSCAGIPIRIK